MKKFLAAMLSAVMIAGSFTGINVNAAELPADNAQQIVNEGGSKPNTTPTTDEDKMLAADGVSISKTIAATEKENYFDITLQVKTPEEVSTIKGDTAVVLVIDKSTTMNLVMAEENRKRLEGAKDAAVSFLNKYSTKEGLGNNRKFAVVAFNTDADVEVPLMTLTEDNVDDAAKDIRGITPVGGNQQWTNIEAGLQLAYNILNTEAATAEHKYVILLTDGFPTTYLINTAENRNKLDDLRGYNPQDTSVPKGQDGAFFDAVKNVRCIYGTSYSDTGASRATSMAQTIKNSGINIMSVGINIGQDVVLDSGAVRPETIDYHNDRMGKYESVVERSSTNYVIGGGSDPEAYKSWLGKGIGGGNDITSLHEKYGAYEDGNNTKALIKAYDDMLNVMEEVAKKSIKDTWFGSDPMGEAVEFMGFYDSENKVSYTDKINWDLKESPAIKETVGNKTTYTYELKYKVRLQNEAEGFAYGASCDTNGTTTLKYVVDDNGKLSDEKTALFPVPAVEGYKGKVVFKKADVDGNELPGAEFKLTHTGAACSVCAGDAAIEERTAVSDENGIVVFDNVPSGHDYTLVETKAPDGYVLSTTVNTVDVDYEKTYLNGVEVTDAQPGMITNEAFDPASYVLTATKSMSDGSTLGTFEFVLKDEEGTTLQTKSNNSTGTVTFDALTFEGTGTYNYTVAEVRPEYTPGGNQNVDTLYDETIYNVEIKVGVNNAETAYEVKEVNYTKVADGTTSSANGMTFANAMRGSAKVEIAGTKYMDGVLANADAFEFTLAPNGDNANDTNESQTVKNGANGVIEFAELTYNTPGTYNYTITEVSADDEDVVYDKNTYDVVVEVTCPQNNSDDYMATVTITGDGGEDEVVFENSTRKAAEVVLTASKEMDEATPAEGAFSFTLTGKDDEGKDVSWTESNDANGLVTFGTMYFTNAGTYEYLIKEVDANDSDVIYDADEYKAIVTVSVPKDGGDTFDVAVVYEKNGKEFSDENVIVPFENSSRAHAFVPVEALKTMDGEPAAEAFTFVLEPDANNANELNERQEVQNDENGVVTFEGLEFGAVGTYYYNVYEVKGDDAQIIYDDIIYTVVVEVTDPGDDDKYATEVRYELPSEDEPVIADEIVFANVTREAAAVVLNAEKTLDGKAPAKDAFTFELKDEEGKVLQTKTNDEKGQIVFDELKYDEAGTYKYTITEKAGNAADIIYDKSVYTVTVEVTVDTETKDGFQAVVTMEKDGAAFEGTPVFENTTVPQVDTGDHAHTMLWTVLAALSAAVVMFIMRRKRA